MKNIFSKVITLVIFFVIPNVIIAQNLPLDSQGRLKTKHSSLLIGGGAIDYTDNYFSNIDYNAFKIAAQREDIYSFFNMEKWIYRGVTDVSLFLNSSGFKMLKMKLSYTGLTYYRFNPFDNFNFYAGAGPYFSFGINTDVTNSNNVFYLNGDLDLRLSGMITYRLPLESFPAMFKLSSEISTVGISFVPEYGQLFGITVPDKSNFVYTNWTNTISHKHQLSVDMPYKNTTYKIAYQYERLSSKLNNNIYKQSGSELYIGFAYEFAKFSGKKSMNKKNIKSLIYE